MGIKLRKEGSQDNGPLRYYELEEVRRAGSRRQWAAIGVLALTTLGSLGIALAAIVKPAPVIVFDSKGRPIVFEETYRPALEPSKIRVEAFTEEFLGRYIGIDSTRLEDDFRQGLNMMYPQLREIVQKEGAEVARREKYRGGNVRSRFEGMEIRMQDFDPKNTSENIYLYAWAKQTFEPVLGNVDEEVSRWIFAKMILGREPVSRTIKWGLLVRYFEYYSFDTGEELELQRLKLMKGDG